MVPPPPASLSGRELPASITSTVDERGGSFGLGTRVPASLMSCGLFGPTAPWEAGRSGVGAGSLCFGPSAPDPGRVPGRGSRPGRWPRDPLSPCSLIPGSTLGRGAQGSVMATGTQRGCGVEGRRRLIQALLRPLCLLPVGRRLCPLWPQFPHREQRVGLAGCRLGGGGWGAFLVPVGVG